MTALDSMQPAAIPPADAIRTLQARRAELLAQLAACEAELAAARLAAGRRPGDGSDQPALFEAEAQRRLW